MRSFSPCSNSFGCSLIAAFLTTAFVQTATAEIAVKSGDKIAFYGDSITVGGWINITGYIRRVMAGLEANGVEGDAVPAGMKGGTSGALLAALESKVLSKTPRWMTLSCGADELWPASPDPEGGDVGAPVAVGETSLETYKQNISQIVERARAAGIQVVMLTIAGKGDDPAGPEHVRVAPYNDFLRSVAKEKSLRLVDLSAMMQEKIKAEKAQREQTGSGKKTSSIIRGPDELHMRFGGSMVIATGILQALGLNEAEMKKAQAVWDAELTAGNAAKAALKARAKAEAERVAKAKAEAAGEADRIAAARTKAEEAAKIKAAAAAKAVADAERIRAQRTGGTPPPPGETR